MDHRRTKKRRTVTEHKRGKWDKDAVVPDVDALRYFAAAGITDMRERRAANILIIKLKRFQIWNKLQRLYLVSPTSADAAKVCAKTLNVATFVNNPTHSSSGISFDAASSQRMDTNLLFDTTSVAIPDIHLGIGYSALNDTFNQHFAGISDGTYVMIQQRSSTGLLSKRVTISGGPAAFLSGGGGSEGVGISTIPAGTNRHMFTNFFGAVGSTSGGAFTANSSYGVNIPIGCSKTTAGVAGNFGTFTLKFWSIGKSISDSVSHTAKVRAFWLAVTAYSTALGR